MIQTRVRVYCFLMRLITRKSTTVWSVSLAIAFLVLGIAWIFGQITPAHALEGQGRLITIYDRGEEKLLLSNGETIGDALKEADITLDDKDLVEPSVDEKMVATEYKVNIYRARPVTVVDGATRLKVLTAYQTSEQIINDIGMSLHSEDDTVMSRSDDLVANGAGLEIEIDRATEFELSLHGSPTTTYTQGETVGDMLKDKGIVLSSNDRVSPAEETKLTKGLAVKVWREGRQTITVEEKVAFATEQIRDADRPEGYREVQTPGVEGARKVTYQIEVIDGKEVSRQEIASLTTTEPVKQVEVIGTKGAVIPYTGGGSKTEWLAASNIPRESWGYADSIVTRESSWNPNAINSSSGACGLAQALPCSKVPGNPLDPVDSLNWMNTYVNGRYGGWQGAYNFWNVNHWY